VPSTAVPSTAVTSSPTSSPAAVATGSAADVTPTGAGQAVDSTGTTEPVLAAVGGDVAQHVELTGPVEGAVVTPGTVSVTGAGMAPGGTLLWRLTTATGAAVGTGFVEVSGGAKQGFSFPVQLPAGGSWVLQLTVPDESGGEASGELVLRRGFRTGQTAPVPADSSAPVTVVSGGPGQGSVQTSGSASFGLSADEAASFQCRFGSAGFAPCSGSYSVSGLGLGVHTLQVRAVDSAGNVDATPESRTWTVVSGTPGAVRPDAGNTGVPAGTVLKRHDGNLTITTPGTVIDSMDIYGFVWIKAPNVTIRRSIIRGGQASNAVGLVTNTTPGATNFLLEDSELVPQFPSTWLDGMKGGNFTMRRVDSHGTVDNVGIHLPNVRIESSWLHGSSWFASSPSHNGGQTHNDAVQVHGGNNISMVGNRMEEANNAAIQMTQDYSRTHDVSIVGNWMNGGGCTVNIADKGKTGMTAITATGNRFGRNTRNADCAIIRGSLVQLSATGNVWDDNGTPVRIRNG